MRRFVVSVWEGSSAGTALVRVLLIPLSWLFRLLVRVRAFSYRRGWLRVTRASTPVVSIGNIVVGGSGKTPLAIWLVQSLRERGVKVAVVTRGYGGTAQAPVIVDFAAHPMTKERTDIEEVVRDAGDEAALVALRAGCPVVACRDRAQACRLAERLYGPDIIVLDDGFQHLGLHRDLDIVVLGGAEASALALPAGPLRESEEALGRADIVIGPLKRVALGLVANARADAQIEPLSAPAGKRAVAVAGIGDPEQFFDMLEQAGVALQDKLCYPDHHPYSAQDCEDIRRRSTGADYVLTTEKDLVRLGSFDTEGVKLRAVRIGIGLDRPSDLLDEVIERLRERVGQLDANDRWQHHRKPHQPATSRGV